MDALAEWIALDDRYQAESGAPGLHLAVHGDAPVVFTAPHAVRHLRAGATKRADIRTGGLAELLARRSGARVLAAIGDPADDPSWHPRPVPFRRALLDLLRPGDLVVDLHGMGDGHAPDVVIGAGPAPDQRATAEAARLAAVLGGCALSVQVGDPFPALHPGTVTAAVQLAGFSALQVELAARRRRPLRAPEMAAPLVAALLEWVAGLSDAAAGEVGADERDHGEYGEEDGVLGVSAGALAGEDLDGADEVEDGEDREDGGERDERDRKRLHRG